MRPEDDEQRLNQLRERVAQLGLTLELRHQNTPGQLNFVLPVRGLASWGAILRHDGRIVASDARNTRAEAIDAALAAYRRAEHRS